MPSESDPLEELLVDADEIDRAALKEAIRHIVGIDSESDEVVLLVGYRGLSSPQRLLAILLGKKAAQLLGRSEKEGLAARDLVRVSGMPRGTVHPTLKGLRERRLVSQTSNGDYYVSRAQLADAIDEVRPRDRNS